MENAHPSPHIHPASELAKFNAPEISLSKLAWGSIILVLMGKGGRGGLKGLVGLGGLECH